MEEIKQLDVDRIEQSDRVEHGWSRTDDNAIILDFAKGVTLRILWNNFKDFKGYNLITYNCQQFAENTAKYLLEEGEYLQNDGDNGGGSGTGEDSDRSSGAWLKWWRWCRDCGGEGGSGGGSAGGGGGSGGSSGSSNGGNGSRDGSGENAGDANNPLFADTSV